MNKHTRIVAFYLLSRLVLLLVGVRIDGISGPLLTQPGNIEFMHLPDLALLQSRFAETLFYLHAQPPLYVAYVGLSAQTGALWAWMTLLSLASGLVLCCAMYRTLLLLRVSQRVSFVVTAIFMITPPVLLWEWYTLYTYQVAALLMLAVYLSLRLSKTRSVRDALVFTAVCAAVALTRGSYHLLWVVAASAFALWLVRSKGGRLLVVVPCLVVFGWYAKNYIVFHTFSSSSWMGMNLYQIATRGTKAEPVFPMVSDTPYKDNPAYDAIPALGNVYKASGDVNYNHYAYIQYGQLRMGQALSVIRGCPMCYLTNVSRATALLMRSSSPYLEYTNNYHILQGWVLFWDNVVYGAGLFGGAPLYITLLLCVPICFVSALWLAAHRPALWFAALTMVYGLVVYVTMDIGENMRFRFELDPLLYVCGVVVAVRVLQILYAQNIRKISPAPQPETAIH